MIAMATRNGCQVPSTRSTTARVISTATVASAMTRRNDSTDR